MIQLKVNGANRSFNGDPEMPLLWYLRDVLGLTGSKFGCGIGLCGACTVHVNGQATRSCVTPIGNTAGKEVTTVEGLEKNGLHPVQRAWMQINVPQCGYCQVGQIMQAAALLNSKKNQTDIRAPRDVIGNDEDRPAQFAKLFFAHDARVPEKLCRRPDQRVVNGKPEDCA